MSADSKFAFNIEVLKTKTGLLKFFEVVVGAICLGLLITSRFPVEILYYSDMFCLCIVMTLFSSFLLLLSNLMSPVSVNTLEKSLFELLHHVVAFLFYIATSMTFLILLSKKRDSHFTLDKPITSAVLGLAVSLLYFMSTFYSYKSFKAA